MQLSASIPTLDSGLAGLLLGVATPAAASAGEVVPPSAGEGFADLLANVATPAAPLALAVPEATAALTASIASPIPTLPGLPAAAVPQSGLNATTPPAAAWPFASNLRLPATGDVAGARLIETTEPEPTVAAVETDVTMAAVPLDITIEADPCAPSSDSTRPRATTLRDENREKPAEETIAMALAFVPQPLAPVAAEASEPTLLTEKAAAFADAGVTEEGSSEAETTAVLDRPETVNQGAQFSPRPEVTARLASSFSPAAPTRFAAASNREITRAPRALNEVAVAEPAATVPAATSREIPDENGAPVAVALTPLRDDATTDLASTPIALGYAPISRRLPQAPTTAPERSVAGGRPASLPVRDEPISPSSVTPPQSAAFSPLPSAAPRPVLGTAPAPTPDTIPTPEAAPTPPPSPAATPDADLLGGLVPLPVAPAPAVRAEGPATQIGATELSDDAAKIADETEFAAPRGAARETRSPRNFVTTTAKQLTSRTAAFGTSIAKTVDAMPFAQATPRSALADFQPASLVLDRGSDTSEVSNASPAPAPEAMSTAHRAVEAVLTAVHRFSASERHTVSLQFAVGDADLRVRVEMRDDEVHATFRTDSSELRAALSHEWNSANASAGERPVRLAPPVFTSNDASGFSAASGDQASQQQRQQRESAAHPANDPFAVGMSRGRGARESAAASAPVSSAAPRPALSTTRHLHTLA